MLKEYLVFFRESLSQFQTTGSITPTTRWAALMLTQALREPGRAPKRIAELGPGTGSVTEHILEAMQPQDTLTICEINPRFMQYLKQKLEKNPLFQKNRDRISFFLGGAQDLPSQPLDVIVCAIPFLNLDVATTATIFSKLQELSSEETVMTYYEYIGLRHIGKLFLARPERNRIRELDLFFAKLYARCALERESIWLNFLPIFVYRLKPCLNVAPAAQVLAESIDGAHEGEWVRAES
jgi:phosphatidylethanolamine/phosphatidyl-N-methylethanolamine N-methyltransferase